MATNSSVYKNASRKSYDITNEKRESYRRISAEALLAKRAAQEGRITSDQRINTPVFDPLALMPEQRTNGIRCLSLFTGGGGLDLGFELAGYKHNASFELIPICGETLLTNRPHWNVYTGPELGDVTKVNWERFAGEIDVVQGGPPCQPFSIAGEQKGKDDERNMWGEFSRAVNTIKPSAFVAENVPGILNPKFKGFVEKYILGAMEDYMITSFIMLAADYGVPQIRKRVFFVGFRSYDSFKRFNPPRPTHDSRYIGENSDLTGDMFEGLRDRTLGVREALGLSPIGFDNLAPTIRSGFTGKRNTTSVLNSTAGQKAWGDMRVWPNGVQKNRETASSYPAKFDHFRLSVQDVSLLQGFPNNWVFSGAVYQQLGQIGNSVCPPVAYQVARAVANALNP